MGYRDYETLYGTSERFEVGQRVVVTGTCSRRFLPSDFVGWGKPGDIESLVPATAGVQGTVTYQESHGHNPWTRYTVRFDDGTWSSGLVPGKDITAVS